MKLSTTLLSLVRDFMLKFWVKNLGYQMVIHLILIAVFLNQKQLLKVIKQIIKSNQTILEKKIKLNLSGDNKILPHTYWLLKHQGTMLLLQIPERDGLMIERITRLCLAKLT